MALAWTKDAFVHTQAIQNWSDEWDGGYNFTAVSGTVLESG